MKTVKQVCRQVGVTRKTLRGYDEMGLLHPTIKSDEGNKSWLYDNNAISKLFVIQTFVEAGYDRKKIKAIFEESDRFLLDEYDHAIELLKEKKKRIEGMIKMLECNDIMLDLPFSAWMALSTLDVESMYQDKSFIDTFNEEVLEWANTSLDEIETKKSYMLISFHQLAIGIMKDQSTDSPELKECIESYCNSIRSFFMTLITDESDKDEWGKAPDNEISIVTYSFTHFMLQQPNFTQALELEVGSGAVNFILDSIYDYAASQYKSKLEFKKDLEEIELEFSKIFNEDSEQ